MLVSFGNTPHRVETGIIAEWCPHCRALRVFTLTEYKPVALHLPLVVFYSGKWQSKYKCLQCEQPIKIDKREEVEVLDSQEINKYPLRLILKNSRPKLHDRIFQHGEKQGHDFVWDPSVGAPVDLNAAYRDRLKGLLENLDPKFHNHPKRLRLLEEIEQWDKLPNVFRFALHEDIQDFRGICQHEALLDHIDKHLPPTYPNFWSTARWTLLTIPFFIVVSVIGVLLAIEDGTPKGWDNFAVFVGHLWCYGLLIAYCIINVLLKNRWIRKYLHPLREEYQFKTIALALYLRTRPEKRTSSLRAYTLRNLAFRG